MVLDYQRTRFFTLTMNQGTFSDYHSVTNYTTVYIGGWFHDYVSNPGIFFEWNSDVDLEYYLCSRLS